MLKTSGTANTIVACTIAVICNAETCVMVSDSGRFGSIFVKVSRTSRSTRFLVTKQNRLSPRNFVFHIQPYETLVVQKLFSKNTHVKNENYYKRPHSDYDTAYNYKLFSIKPEASETYSNLKKMLLVISLPVTKFHRRFHHSISNKDDNAA